MNIRPAFLLFLFYGMPLHAQEALKASLPEVTTISRAPDRYAWEKAALVKHRIIFGNAIAVTDSAVYSFGGFNTVSPLREMNRLENGLLIRDSIRYPGQGFYDNLCFVHDSLLYIGGGKDSSKSQYAFNDFWQYNLSSGQWRRLHDLPYYYMKPPYAFATDGRELVLIHRLQGAGFKEQVPVLYRYDFAADKWGEASGAFPEQGLLNPVAFQVEDQLYVLFQARDYADRTRNSFYDLDLNTGVWSLLPSFPGTLRQSVLAFSDGVYGFMGGGVSSSGVNCRDMYRYDPVLRRWEAIAPLPLGVRYAKGWRYRGESYAGFGINDHENTVAVWKLVRKK